MFLLYVPSHTGKAFEGYFSHGKTTENPPGSPVFSSEAPRDSQEKGLRVFSVLYFGRLSVRPSLPGNPAPARPRAAVPYPGERGRPGTRRRAQPSRSSPLAET